MNKTPCYHMTRIHNISALKVSKDVFEALKHSSTLGFVFQAPKTIWVRLHSGREFLGEIFCLVRWIMARVLIPVRLAYVTRSLYPSVFVPSPVSGSTLPWAGAYLVSVPGQGAYNWVFCLGFFSHLSLSQSISLSWLSIFFLFLDLQQVHRAKLSFWFLHKRKAFEAHFVRLAEPTRGRHMRSGIVSGRREKERVREKEKEKKKEESDL